MEAMARPRVYPDDSGNCVRLVREWQEAPGVTDGGYTAISKQLGIRREPNFLRTTFIPS